MIIPRFKYSYTFKDTLSAVKGLWREEISELPILNELFPDSTTHLVGSARIGIKFALEAFHLREGAKVGVQPYTCSSVMAAIRAAGCTPLFIDINEKLTLSCGDLSRRISELDALIVTHTFGFPAEIDEIKKIIGKIPVLEDCAHALFSQYDGRQLGTFFDASVFSFGNGKFPSLGNGGLLVINNPQLHTFITRQLNQLPTVSVYRELICIGKYFLMSQLHSKLLQKFIKIFVKGSYWDSRNKEVILYDKVEFNILKSTKKLLLKKVAGHKELSLRQHRNSEYLAKLIKEDYTFLVDATNFTNSFSFVLIEENRDSLYRYLRQKNIMGGKHFQHAVAWASAYGYRKGDCPVFEQMVDKILTVPCYYNLRKGDLDHIVDSLTHYRNINALHENNFS